MQNGREAVDAAEAAAHLKDISEAFVSLPAVSVCETPQRWDEGGVVDHTKLRKPCQELMKENGFAISCSTSRCRYILAC